MDVLGPYQFLTEAENVETCGCGTDECAVIQVGDRITFQIPADENCCSDVEGCPQLTETCFDDADMEVPAIGNYETEFTATGLCFDSPDYDPDNVVIEAPVPDAIIGPSEEVLLKVCVCISGNETDILLRLFVDGTQSDTFTGNGTFCFYLMTDGLLTDHTFGILQEGGGANFAMCFSCLTVCRAKTWTASLIGVNDTVVSPMTVTDMQNGNRGVNFLTTGEIEPGCYNVKLENDCDEDPWFSNCFTIQDQVNCSVKLKWRNRTSVYGYDYADDAFYNEYRANGKVYQPSYPIEKRTFLLSNNENRQTNAQTSEEKILSLGGRPRIPDYAHKAIALGTTSSEFYINDELYVVSEGPYRPDWSKSNDEVAPVRLTVINQNFDGINNYCS